MAAKSKISSHVASITSSLCKGLAILGAILFFQYIFLSSHPSLATIFLSPLGLLQPPLPNYATTPTTLNHLVFGVSGSIQTVAEPISNIWCHMTPLIPCGVVVSCTIYALVTPGSILTSYSSDPINFFLWFRHCIQTWSFRKSYIESWWRPNVTRGYLFLDTSPTELDFLPWSTNSPPFRVSDNISTLIEETKHVAGPIQARMAHAVLEVVREGDKGVRWYVMGDDDSILFVDNLVDVLSKYDHTKYVYVGGHSENVFSNFQHSFDMGFGGAGFALSYPMAKMLAENLEDCLRRYPMINVQDQILESCAADYGVSVTFEKGLHQIDLGGDISGLLSSHPQAPLLSLHHLDNVDPIFPVMNRFESVNHLMEAANVDQSRLLQQTICYHKQTNWSFSVSWGYSTHIYEQIIPRSRLKKPLETFTPWWLHTETPPFYMFNTRQLSNDPCEAPHIFSFKSVNKSRENKIVTSYDRVGQRGLPICSESGNHSADHITKIQVFSSIEKPDKVGRSECCDVEYEGNMDMAKVILRTCAKDELIA